MPGGIRPAEPTGPGEAEPPVVPAGEPEGVPVPPRMLVGVLPPGPPDPLVPLVVGVVAGAVVVVAPGAAVVVVAPPPVVLVVVSPPVVLVVVPPPVVLVVPPPPVVLVVSPVPGVVLAVKLFVIVATQVTVLAPVVPDALHWLMVVGRPVVCDGGAVAVQVKVPPAPPELLHWVTLCPPGPAVPVRSLPGGTATQVLVVTPPGLSHWVTVESIAEPTGYPVRLLVTVAVHVTVLAPPSPAMLHWLIEVTGVVDDVDIPGPQLAEPVQLSVVTIDAEPVGIAGVAGLYVNVLVIVTAQVMVALAPAVPMLLHWSIGAASARVAFPPTTVSIKTIARTGAAAIAPRRRDKRMVRPMILNSNT